MNDNAEKYRDRLMNWLRPAVDEGWIAREEINGLESLETRGAEFLFDEKGERPLTVAFFGGTGVGKSSLLNRLVGEPVAKVGLERPTSTEVTVYVHRHYPLKHLGRLLPVDRARVLEHSRDEYREVVWIDMPDIDSVERANRDLVFEWLPYIDWLIYVVSPERYRDDVGWQIMKRRGHRHHWLFVMNHWDTGSNDQLMDFEELLSKEGFDEARILTTSCAGEIEEDHFAEIAATIDEAIARHGMAQLQQVGERARIADLNRLRERYAAMLGTETQWRELVENGGAAMEAKLSELNTYLREEAVIEAAYVADQPTDDSFSNNIHEPARPDLVADYVQDLQSVISVSLGGLPAAPIREKTWKLMETLDERLVACFRQGFREGIARPGSAPQRTLVTWMRKLVYGLPLVVCVGIAYLVLKRYEQGIANTGEFLGLDFLFHSAMILGLSALGPFLLARLLRPSVRRSIVKRVEDQLRRLRNDVLRQWTDAMKELSARSGEMRSTLAETCSGDVP